MTDPAELGKLQIPDGAKFAILAVETSSLPAPGGGVIELGSGERALFQSGMPIPDEWKKWLGSLRAEQFLRSNLVIIVTEASQQPGILDDQSNRLDLRTKEVFFGVLLQGSPFGFRGGPCCRAIGEAKSSRFAG